MDAITVGLQQSILWDRQWTDNKNIQSVVIERFRYRMRYLLSLMTAKLQAVRQESRAQTQSVDVNAEAERLLTEYGNAILRMAYSYLQNMSDAEEILQDTMIQYLTKAPAFSEAEHEKAWLLHVAANLSKNRIRYNKIRMTDELDETLAAEEREDLAFVWEAVKSLPDKYREVIHLHYKEGYQTAEIAQILNRRESTVRSDLRRGREKLKQILKEAYDFE